MNDEMMTNTENATDIGHTDVPETRLDTEDVHKHAVSQDDSADAHPQSRDERRDERTRTRLREAEAERDRYRAALLPHVRTAIEKSVRSRLSDPAALWLLPDLDPVSLLDDELAVDVEKVDAAIRELHERLPSTAKRFTGSGDGGPRGASVGGDSTASWSSVIRP